MAADRFINWLVKKYNKTKIIGEMVPLSALEPGDYFIFPNLYNGLIGQLLECGTNAKVKWVTHPERKSSKAEIIAASATVYKYNYS
jgi:hypothetical protein